MKKLFALLSLLVFMCVPVCADDIYTEVELNGYKFCVPSAMMEMSTSDTYVIYGTVEDGRSVMMQCIVIDYDYNPAFYDLLSAEQIADMLILPMFDNFEREEATEIGNPSWERSIMDAYTYDSDGKHYRAITELLFDGEKLVKCVWWETDEIKFGDLMVQCFSDITPIDAPAETDTQEEPAAETSDASSKSIQFRNMPWGLTYADFVANLGGEYDWWKGNIEPVASSFDNTVQSIYYTVLDADCPKELRVTRGGDDGSIGFFIDYPVPPFDLAGNKLNWICLYFMQPVVDGKIDYNRDDAFLYMAHYELGFPESGGLSGLAEQLEQKLTDLYGEPKQRIDIPESATLDDIWEDEQGNTLCLAKKESNNMYCRVFYMSGSALDDIQAINDALGAGNHGDTNYDGL